MKKYIFLISHGKLAEGMLSSLQMLIGETDGVTAYGLMPGENPDTIAASIETFLLDHAEDRIFILADLLGGSVSNAATRLSLHSNVRMVNGMNLASVVSIFLAPTDISDEELEDLLAEARDGLSLVSFVLETEEDDEIL